MGLNTARDSIWWGGSALPACGASTLCSLDAREIEYRCPLNGDPRGRGRGGWGWMGLAQRRGAELDLEQDGGGGDDGAVRVEALPPELVERAAGRAHAHLPAAPAVFGNRRGNDRLCPRGEDGAGFSHDVHLPVQLYVAVLGQIVNAFLHEYAVPFQIVVRIILQSLERHEQVWGGVAGNSIRWRRLDWLWFHSIHHCICSSA